MSSILPWDLQCGCQVSPCTYTTSNCRTKSFVLCQQQASIAAAQFEMRLRRSLHTPSVPGCGARSLRSPTVLSFTQKSLILLYFPLDLILYPGSGQGAKKSPILWQSPCHTPSFATARSRGGGNQSVIRTAALQTDRPLLALQHWVFLPRGRHRLPLLQASPCNAI